MLRGWKVWCGCGDWGSKLMSLQLLKNVPRPEVFQAGWSTFRTAPAVSLASRKPDGSFAYDQQGFDQDELSQTVPSNNLWREPNKGILMLRPNVLSYAAEDAAPVTWIPLSGFRQAGDFLDVEYSHRESSPVICVTSRTDPDGPLNGISAPGSAAGFDVSSKGLTWAAETLDPFYANEGWMVVIVPFGSPLDGSPNLCALHFGGIWMLEVRGDGSMPLYRNVGEPGSPEWRLQTMVSTDVSFSDPSQPLHLTILPWGIDCLTISLARSEHGIPSLASDFGNSTRSAFLFEGRRYGMPITYSSEMRQTIKTFPGTWSIALPTFNDMLGFGLTRVRYRACGMALMPEHMGEPRADSAPMVEPLGFFGQRSGSGDGGATALKAKVSGDPGAAIWDVSGGAWEPASSTQVVAETWLTPSASGLYSPEVWAFSYTQAPHLVTPESTSEDLADHVLRVMGSLHSEPEPAWLRADLLQDTIESGKLLNTSGRWELVWHGETLFEGHWYAESAEPWVANGTCIEAVDLWGLANSTSASHFGALTGSSYAEICASALKRLGALDEEIDIDPELENFYVEGFVAPPTDPLSNLYSQAAVDDWKVIHENGSVGDVLRALIDRFAAQGAAGQRRLRVFRRGGVWRVRLSPSYSGETSATLFLGSPPDSAKTDEERFEAKEFRVLSIPKFGTVRPRFNGLTAMAPTGTGRDSEVFTCFVAPDPASLNDPASPNFVGARHHATLGPPDTALASTQNELERYARSVYDLEGTPLRTLQIEAEWQPSLLPDDFVEVLGNAYFDDPGGAFETGDLVSYGAWRVDRIDYELTARNDGSLEFDQRANLSLSFAGLRQSGPYPNMFAEGMA